METVKLDIKLVDNNVGQIKGLRKNPRFIKNEKYHNLLRSLRDDPEMLELRECIVFPLDGRYVCIAGNYRLRGWKELKHKTVPCKVLSEDTPLKKLQAYALKDNVSSGEYDKEELAQWDMEILENAGMDIEDFLQPEKAPGKIEQEKIVAYKKTHVLISFPPEMFLEVQEILEKVINLDGVEYEQSNN